MLRRKPLLLVGAAIALAGAGVSVIVATHGGGARPIRETSDQAASQPSAKKTYAQLVAANYKILTPQQSAHLLRYADTAFACMSKDVDLSKPRTSPLRIVMTVPPGAKPSAVLRTMGRCATKIGDPPAGSSFQLRGDAVIVYLPKYCILDNKTVARTAALPHQ